MNRRLFGVMIAKVLGGILVYGPGMSTPMHDELRVLLSTILSDLSCARSIGKECLVAGEAKRLNYDDAAQALYELSRRPMLYEHHDLSSGVQKLIRADYDMNDTVCVDGWILSRTEACLCILARYV